MKLFKSVFTLSVIITMASTTLQAQEDFIRSQGAGNERNGLIKISNDNFKYVVTNVFQNGSTTRRDFIVTRYTPTGNISWQRRYGNLDRDEAAVSIDVDIDGTLIVLCNAGPSNNLLLNQNVVEVFQIQGPTGNLLRFNRTVSPVNGQNLIAVKIVAKHLGNGHYWIFSNVQNGNKFESILIYELSRFWFPAPLRVNHILPSSQEGIAVYDAAVTNDAEAYICGMHINEGFIARVNLGTTPSFAAFRGADSHPAQNSAVDRIVAYNTPTLQQRIAVAATGINDNLCYAILDGTLNLLDVTGINTTQEVGERTNSLHYNTVNQTIYATGILPSQNHGFILSLDPSGDNLTVNWIENPSSFLQINNDNSFRSDFFDNRIFFATNAHSGNVNNHDLYWGNKGLSAGDNSCFVPTDWIDNNSQLVNNQLVATINNLAPETLNLALPNVQDVILSDRLACVTCNLNTNEATLINSLDINGHTTWGTNNQGPKYQISGIVTVTAGSLLDITNCDLYFTGVGEIIVEEGGSIRANNSVFRTCNPEMGWRGITFRDNTSGIIEECLFKNASVALNIIGTNNPASRCSLRITGNTFTNCRTSISFNNIVNSNSSVNNNNFTIDNTPVFFMDDAVFVPGSGTNPYLGILVFNSLGELTITQNNFNNSFSRTPTKTLYGISATQTVNEINIVRLFISDNLFTNCHNGVTVNEVYASEILRNNFTINESTNAFDYQIRVHNSNSSDNSVSVSENSISISAGSVSNGGIYTENGLGVYVSNNVIRGGVIGIHSIGNSGVKIFSNKIFDSRDIGIYGEDLSNSTIRCNELDMAFKDVGIMYFQNNSEENNVDIRGNCIFNTQRALIVETSNEGDPIPVIRNNYLYNYKIVGIQNTGFNGLIGDPGNPDDYGRNTFLSNNYGASNATDISSDQPIVAAGNFNTIFFDPTVALLLDYEENTNASCSRFFSNTTMSLKAEDVCNGDYIGTSTPMELMISTDNKKWVLNEDFFNVGISKTSDEDRLSIYIDAIDFLSNYQPEQLDKLVQMLDKSEPNKSIKEISIAYLSIKNHDYTEALAHLNQVQPTDAFILQMKQDYLLLIDYATSKISETELLEKLALKEPTLLNLYNKAYSNITPVNLSYNFKHIQAKPYTVRSSNNVLSVKKPEVQLYPNPSNEFINVEYSTGNNPIEQFSICNAIGKELISEQIAFSGGTKTIDISGLAPGAYMIVFKLENGTSICSKFLVN